ncbi:MAG: ThiF family adenylyltransferase [Gammaproteobacteria bacterium]
MPARVHLTVPASLHAALHTHLFPGDGLEAAALLLCSRSGARLTAVDWIAVPYDACETREADRLSWPGTYVEAAIDRAETERLSIIAAHSHPGGYFDFSDADDTSDRQLVPALHQAIEAPHGTAIMVPSGAMRARLYRGAVATWIERVTVPGDDIRIWWNDGATASGPGVLPIAFTSGMTRWFKRMTACVIGVSGTGSIVAEQLARLGFGRIILIDFDRIEHKNLNRILNATWADAEARALKVEAFACSIRAHHPDTEVVVIPTSVDERAAVLAAAEADVLFTCVDDVEGRHIADRIASYFAVPLFDVGVSIPTRATRSGERAIAEVVGRIDYVQPGGSTLKDRGVYDAASLEAAYLRRVAPATHAARVKEGYLPGITEEAPAVITLNMRAAADCVMELIARLFPFRHDPNAAYARTIFMLADGDIERFPESDFTRGHEYPVGVGQTEPLLGLPMLGASRTEAA